jgi:hypothetical protein
MPNKLVRPVVVGVAALAAVAFSPAPANATTAISFRMVCDSGYSQILCQTSAITGGTAPYTERWTSDPYTYVDSNGSGTCTPGHSYSVTLTVTDSANATRSVTRTGLCNTGGWT